MIDAYGNIYIHISTLESFANDDEADQAIYLTQNCVNRAIIIWDNALEVNCQRGGGEFKRTVNFVVKLSLHT